MLSKPFFSPPEIQTKFGDTQNILIVDGGQIISEELLYCYTKTITKYD